MITTILVDDEPMALTTLEGYLHRYCPEIKIIGKATSVAEAYKLIMEQPPQLLFLETAMSKETGFELLKKLPSLDFEIIFVTNFDEHALKAMRMGAIGYITKPIQSNDLITALKRAKKIIGLKVENERNKQLLQNLAQPQNPENRIAIPTDQGFELVLVKNIIRCEGYQRCTKVFIRDRKTIVSSYNLGEFKKLLEPLGFFSPHRSHLVNLSQVRRYDKIGNITMEDQSHVPVSRRKKQAFLDNLKHL